MIDITGEVFGKLTAIEEAPKIKIKRRWKVKCECGDIFCVDMDSLRGGKSKACSSCAKTRHGHAKVESKVYRVWGAMIARCSNSKHKDFKNYGFRGITVCERWKDFRNFLEDMGEPPREDSTIDRADNNLGYEKSNCRWSDRTTQILNQRKRANCSSEYKGVSVEEGRIRARIWIEGRMCSLGVFSTLEEAAKAWDAKAREIYGDDTWTNFPIKERPAF